MLYIETGSTDPYYNLAFEEYVFSTVGQHDDCFMLWQNKNSIIIGRYQNTLEEINYPFVKEHGIRVVRRLSGGGAVYHDLGNLNFTFIVSADEHKDFDFKVFILPLIELLRELGVDADFNGRNDITVDGRKFSGNSQYARGGRLLHHGTLMLSSDLSVVSGALNAPDDKFESKSAKSVRSRVTTIESFLPEPIGMDEFRNRILKKIFEHTPMKQWTPSYEDTEAIKRLQDEKYGTREWNFGKDPPCSVRKHRRFPGVGSVTLAMDVSACRINSLSIFGDYFGNKDCTDLEDALKGCPLEEQALKLVLSDTHPSEYISGIRDEDFLQLLLQ